MKSLYHGTGKEQARNIWENNKIVPKKNWEKRQKMREELDKYGFAENDNWISRQNAVFAWATFERARRFAEAHYTDPAIVEFECNGDAMCTENLEIENIYDYYPDVNESAFLTVAYQSREWTGQRKNDLEVWMRPAAVGDITAVYDPWGDLLEF